MQTIYAARHNYESVGIAVSNIVTGSDLIM